MQILFDCCIIFYFCIFHFSNDHCDVDILCGTFNSIYSMQDVVVEQFEKMER